MSSAIGTGLAVVLGQSSGIDDALRVAVEVEVHPYVFLLAAGAKIPDFLGGRAGASGAYGGA